MTQIPSIYPVILENNKPEVFANLKLFQSLSQSVAFYVESVMTINVMTKMSLVLLGMYYYIDVLHTKHYCRYIIINDHRFILLCQVLDSCRCYPSCRRARKAKYQDFDFKG